MKERESSEAINYLRDIVEPGQEEDYLDTSQERYVMTLGLIPDVSEKLRVLDLGSGFGHLSILIKKIFGYEVHAVDHNSIWEERFRKEGIEFNLCELTTQSLLFEENYFDLVLCCEVIEHLLILPHRMLLDIQRVLKPQGKLILTTPNTHSLIKRIRFLLGKRIIPRLSAPGDERIQPNASNDYGELHSLVQARLRKRNDLGGSHLREYDLDELSSLLDETGFRVLLVRCLQGGSIIKELSGALDLNPLHIIYRSITKAYSPWGEYTFIVGQKE